MIFFLCVSVRFFYSKFGGVQSLVKSGFSSMAVVVPHPILVVLCLSAVFVQGSFDLIKISVEEVMVVL